MNVDTKAGERDAVKEKIQDCRKNGSKELDLSGCGIAELPPELAELKQLTVLDLSRNSLKSLPEFVSGLVNLEYLDLSGNELETVPDCIGDLSQLGTLKLGSNRLKTLPESIEKIPLLETLEISGNEIANPGDYTNPMKTDDILDHMDKIVTYSQKNGLTRLFYKIARAHISFVSERLDITPIQAILFSHLCNNANQRRIFFSEIAEEMHCNVIKNIQFRNEFDELERRKFIRCMREYSRSNNTISYCVPMNVQESLRKNNTVILENNTNLDFYQFFSILDNLFSEKRKGELTYETLEVEILTLVDNNLHLDFCKKIKKCFLQNMDKIMLIYFCGGLILAEIEEISIDLLENIFVAVDPEGFDSSFYIRRALRNGTHSLIKQLYIENAVHENMFGSRESFRLTRLAKEEFLSGIDLQADIKLDQKDLLHAENISEKNLFYNEKEAHRIKRLTELLQKDCFLTVQDSLSKKGLRKGFACFFYGPPGTGKTETVYQIARLTGRSILFVDLSQTKSCWYGESEKKIRSIFSRYKRLVENSALTPILLFNEADGIFGKRTEIGGVNPALEKTENTVQNIILEELETLSGILIATTNLTNNFDPAFERRFLYKIEFEKPCAAVRTSIWQSVIPELSEQESRLLAGRFDFSGGQIENIARKRTVESILSGAEPDLETLIAFCQDELINKGTGNRIGFGAVA
jgi:hypothetical protein